MNLKLADTLRRFRKEKDMTQEDVADALGVTCQAVSRWETASAYPDIELFPALAALFDVSIDALFGMDSQTEEYKLGCYEKEIAAAKGADETISITRRYITELPKNSELKYKLLSLYQKKGLEYAKCHIEEMRALCRYVIAHSDGQYWMRQWALHKMILVEDDDRLGDWLSELDNRAEMTFAQALTDRYDYRNEVDKYNISIQTDILNSLLRIFSEDFCKRDQKTYKNAASRAEGQKAILGIIDILRDSSTDRDAWIGERAFDYLRLAAGEFGRGDTEAGFAALEKSVDLYFELANIPDGTMLVYNHPSLDLLGWELTPERKREIIYEAFRPLTEPSGWEWFNCVREDERFKAQIARISEALAMCGLKV